MAGEDEKQEVFESKKRKKYVTRYKKRVRYRRIAGLREQE